MHNGEIKGGAKYTMGRKWEFILYLSGFPSNIIALQCEWRCKHPYGKKKRGKSGDIGRIEGIKHVLNDTILDCYKQTIKHIQKYNL